MLTWSHSLFSLVFIRWQNIQGLHGLSSMSRERQDLSQKLFLISLELNPFRFYHFTGTILNQIYWTNSVISSHCLYYLTYQHLIFSLPWTLYLTSVLFWFCSSSLATTSYCLLVSPHTHSLCILNSAPKLRSLTSSLCLLSILPWISCILNVIM